jgi:23S rRNA (adenine2503-C2)-methyltransferase
MLPPHACTERLPEAGADLGALRERLHGLGANAAHVHRIVRLWAQALPQDSGRRRLEDFMPQRVRAALPALCAELARLTRLASTHPSPDGSARLLLELRDAHTVEAVLLPRGGLCVSTQVGCAVGCLFCMTGRGGLVRQLSSAEIVAQVALARSLRAVTKVVFMGMGEPAHNLDAVLEAIELLGDEGGIAHKQLVFSTVGDNRAFDRLASGRVKPALALSLHSTRADVRARLLPRAPRIEPAELVRRADAYARATGYPVQYQWTLLGGVNDGEDEVEGIVALLRGRFAVLNLILYNRVDDAPFHRTPAPQAQALARRLLGLGILTKLRRSAGQEVDGGCGQLRSRTLPGNAGQPIRWPEPAPP